MNHTIAIRLGTAADLPHVCHHWLSMFEEVGNYFERDFPLDWRSRFESYFRRRMDAHHAAFFVATDGPAIVGTCGALVRDGYPVDITGLSHGYIFGVRVEPAYRRRGIAERLTREAIAYLERSSCRTIRLHASRFGRSVYERIGFVASNEMELPRR